MALSIIEGMQHGQSFGALLGYQLERGLHDRYEEAEVDEFIYSLRTAFPLRSNRMKETSVKEEDIESISQIEARNVVDGYALVNHINKTGKKNYPFGKNNLLAASNSQKAVINSEVERLINITDAIADVATAEGIHQAVQANDERAAGTSETYSKGNFPQSPEVIKTPRTGIGITNRVGIHLENNVPPSSTNPRVLAEPSLNKFVEHNFPVLSNIACKVVYKLPSYKKGTAHAASSVKLSLDNLGLTALDLLYMLDIDDEKNLTVLDDYILKWFYENVSGVRPDSEVEIIYTETLNPEKSLFEIAPLIKSLRSLILTSRPLKRTDLSLSNEATKEDDNSSSISLHKVDSAFTSFKSNFSDPTDFFSGLDITNNPFVSLIDSEEFELTLANKSQILTGIDAYIHSFIERMKILSLFGIPSAGFGFIFNSKSAIYSSFYKKILDLKTRWEGKHTRYQELMTQYSSATEEDEQLELLQKAERTVSTSYTLPVPPPPDTISDYEAIVISKESLFTNKLGEITNWLSNSYTTFTELLASIKTLDTGVGSATGNALGEFDLVSLDIEEEEKQIVVLAEDMCIQANKLKVLLSDKAVKIEELLRPVNPKTQSISELIRFGDAAKILFGEDFKIIPEFKLGIEQGGEIQNSINDTDQLLDYQKTERDLDFPVDNWLYSVARVREKMENWENLTILSEGLINNALDLTPIQLPYKSNDCWLGLSFPEDYEIGGDKLLYTAYLKSFDPSQKLCGLLIDEWIEIIPSDKETTGITFQYDQPNAEPPQTMLLVTPNEFTGQWDWNNLVEALHESLEMANLRAVDPAHIDNTEYAQFLPSTVSTVTTYPFITMALNYANNNNLFTELNTNNDA
jgi:hypothetical protein